MLERQEVERPGPGTPFVPEVGLDYPGAIDSKVTSAVERVLGMRACEQLRDFKARCLREGVDSVLGLE